MLSGVAGLVRADVSVDSSSGSEASDESVWGSSCPLFSSSFWGEDKFVVASAVMA